MSKYKKQGVNLTEQQWANLKALVPHTTCKSVNELLRLVADHLPRHVYATIARREALPPSLTFWERVKNWLFPLSSAKAAYDAEVKGKL